MVQLFIQLGIIAIWAAVLSTQTRRLFRLAHVTSTLLGRRDPELRQSLQRVWWWLGRAEFWRTTQNDILHCVQLTLMGCIMAWNVPS
jgi:hypothetical protein